MNKHPDLRVRVVHGNTLTAAVILNEIPKDVEEVFLSGATSKLGRAIALYLCRRKVRVLVSILFPFSSFTYEGDHVFMLRHVLHFFCRSTFFLQKNSKCF